MQRTSWIALLGVVLFALPQNASAQYRGRGERYVGGQPHRFTPVGGWNPYGGGPCHWWNPGWSQYCGTCDDYCRKSAPRTQGPLYCCPPGR